MLEPRGKRGIFTTRFTAPDGRRISRSTGTANRKEAEEFEVRLRSKLWRVHKLGDRPRRSWKDAVVRFSMEREHLRSFDRYLDGIEWLDATLPRVNLSVDSALEAFTRDRIDALIDIRSKEGVAPATVNRTLSPLRAILRTAEKDWEWIDRAPKVRLLKSPRKRVRYLTRVEADRLLAELPQHLNRMVRFSLATGLRERNVTRLEWSQVDEARATAWIHGDQAKNGRTLSVPLNADALTVLQECRGDHPTRVFTWRPMTKEGPAEPRPIEDRPNNTAWRKALGRAGIEAFRWHDLRHTWASWHVMAGTPLQVLMELGGWSSLDMVLVYAHLAPSHHAAHAGRVVRPELRLVVDNDGAKTAQPDRFPEPAAVTA